MALLCINFYLNTSFSEILTGFIPEISSRAQMKTETFANNLDELIYSKVSEVRNEVMENDHILPSLKNKEIINILCQQGVFYFKGCSSKGCRVSGYF